MTSGYSANAPSLLLFSVIFLVYFEAPLVFTAWFLYYIIFHRVIKPSKRNSGREPLASTQRLSNSMVTVQHTLATGLQLIWRCESNLFLHFPPFLRDLFVKFVYTNF